MGHWLLCLVNGNRFSAVTMRTSACQKNRHMPFFIKHKDLNNGLRLSLIPKCLVDPFHGWKLQFDPSQCS